MRNVMKNSKLHLVIFVSCVLALLAFQSLKAQVITQPDRLADLHSMYGLLANDFPVLAAKANQLMDTGLTGDEKLALEFIYAYLPLSDLACYSPEFHLQQVKMALRARAEMPWGRNVPESEFLHFVLPLRVNNENLDTFRIAYYEELKKRVAGLGMADAALEINHWCHEHVTYRGSDERTSSPLASMRTSFGRCGEESTFAVTALRTVGIPARQVYTPRWAHTDDNHAWVEVWVDGQWHYLGACEPEPALDMGWFTEPARRAMLVHTRAFGKYFGSEKVMDRQARFSELNLISNYAPSALLTVQILDGEKHPLAGAKVEFGLYNYAEFYPLSRQTTSATGCCSIYSGLGDLMVFASSGNARALSKVSIGQQDTLQLVLADTNPVAPSDFDIVPPIARDPVPTRVTESSRQWNNLRLNREDSIRTNYMSTFPDSAWIVGFASQHGFEFSRVQPLFNQSYGNWKVLADFLSEVRPDRHRWALLLLENISEKDLRDIELPVLRDHLDKGFRYNNPFVVSDPDFYAQYVLSPRIANEKLTPWRSFLAKQFGYNFVMHAKEDVKVIEQWVRDSIRLDNARNLHSRAPLSPEGVYGLRMADARSRDIFFVALCRTLGQAARLEPATSVPQFFRDSTWHTVFFDERIQEPQPGKVNFVLGTGSFEPKYAVHFSIARLNNGSFSTLDLEFDQILSAFKPFDVLPGTYRLTTGNRQLDGSVLCRVSYFEVEPGKTTDVMVNLRESLIAEPVLGHIDPQQIVFANCVTAMNESLKPIQKDRAALLLWVEPEKEPSRHVMADLAGMKNLLRDAGTQVVFILPETVTAKEFQSKYAGQLPEGCRLVWDKGHHAYAQMSKAMNKKSDAALPVVMSVSAQGDILLYSSGYTIGLGERLARNLLKH